MVPGNSDEQITESLPTAAEAKKEAAEKPELCTTADVEAFDPYYRWLGIPPTEQPPNHYRLLGLVLFEKDPNVIDEAADRQMAHIRTHQGGKYAKATQKLLNEVSAARICLLNAEARAAYDAKLPKRIEQTAAPIPRPTPPPSARKHAPARGPARPQTVPMTAPERRGSGHKLLDEFEETLGKLSRKTAGVTLVSGRARTEVVPGQCPECGHQHIIDPQAGWNREFCESCGRALVETCFKCGAENRVWAKFCGPCGADLLALVKAEIEKLQRNRSQIESHRNADRYKQALTILKEMERVSHPRLLDFRRWARETRVEVERVAGAAECAAIVQLGEKADYEQAIQRLKKMIDDDGSHLDDFRRWAHRMLEHMVEEMTQAKDDREQKMHQAEELAGSGGYREAVELLETVPEAVRTERFSEVLNRCASSREMVSELRKAIQARINAARFTEAEIREVQSLVWQLIQLQPNDAHLQTTLKRLEDRERSEDERLWETSRKQASTEAFRHYLESFPNGEYVESARHLLASGLRERLMQDFHNRELRKEYLGVRTASLAKEDDARALMASAVACAIAGAVGGALVGMVAGVLGGAIGGMIGGMVGGAIVAAYAERP